MLSKKNSTFWDDDEDATIVKLDLGKKKSYAVNGDDLWDFPLDVPSTNGTTTSFPLAATKANSTVNNLATLPKSLSSTNSSTNSGISHLKTAPVSTVTSIHQLNKVAPVQASPPKSLITTQSVCKTTTTLQAVASPIPPVPPVAPKPKLSCTAQRATAVSAKVQEDEDEDPFADYDELITVASVPHSATKLPSDKIVAAATACSAPKSYALPVKTTNNSSDLVKPAASVSTMPPRPIAPLSVCPPASSASTSASAIVDVPRRAAAPLQPAASISTGTVAAISTSVPALKSTSPPSTASPAINKGIISVSTLASRTPGPASTLNLATIPPRPTPPRPIPPAPAPKPSLTATISSTAISSPHPTTSISTDNSIRTKYPADFNSPNSGSVRSVLNRYNPNSSSSSTQNSDAGTTSASVKEKRGSVVGLGALPRWPDIKPSTTTSASSTPKQTNTQPSTVIKSTPITSVHTSKSSPPVSSLQRAADLQVLHTHTSVVMPPRPTGQPPRPNAPKSSTANMPGMSNHPTTWTDNSNDVFSGSPTHSTGPGSKGSSNSPSVTDSAPSSAEPSPLWNNVSPSKSKTSFMAKFFGGSKSTSPQRPNYASEHSNSAATTCSHTPRDSENSNVMSVVTPPGNPLVTKSAAGSRKSSGTDTLPNTSQTHSENRELATQPPPVPPRKPKFASILKNDLNANNSTNANLYSGNSLSTYYDNGSKSTLTAASVKSVASPPASKIIVAPPARPPPQPQSKPATHTTGVNSLQTSNERMDAPSPSSSSLPQPPVAADLLREGQVVKISGGGNEQLYHFTLTSRVLTYTESGNIGNPDKLRMYELTQLMAFENEDDYEEGRECSFRLMTKQKSWRMRTANKDEKVAWMKDIVAAATSKQRSEIGRVLTVDDLAPMLEAKKSVSACQLCSRPFGFLGLGAARHNCKNCGKVVCDNCSRERVRIERLDDHALLKVCNSCATTLKNNRHYGH